MKNALAVAGLAVLALAACSSDESDDLTKALLASAQAEGIDADEDCVKDVAGQLSDEDAAALLASEGDIDNADLSPEGFSTTAGLLNCVDTTEIVDQAIADLRAQGLEFDEQCVRDAFAGVDFSEFTSDGGVPEELTGTLLACVDVGG